MNKRNLLACGCALVVASCGGGGEGSGGSPPAATRPAFTSGTTASVTENSVDSFYQAVATDPQGDAIAYTIYSGVDAGRFAMDGAGRLRLNGTINWDKPADADLDNLYEVTLRATAGGESVDLPLRVTVLNDKEGISVKRVATGLVEPVALDWIGSGDEMLIAERGGRVLRFDTATRRLTEDALVANRKRPGTILAAAYAFEGQFYSESTLLITHSSEGLALQAIEPEGKLAQYRIIGEPWSQPVTASLFDGTGGKVLFAVGDPGGSLAQVQSSAYGKVWEIPPADPYAGASIPPPGARFFLPSIIGTGVRQPGGGARVENDTYLADQGGTVEHGLYRFSPFWRPLDFGWPFYEGSKAARSNPPARSIGPTIAYTVGTGRREGTGIVAGLLFGGAISSLDRHYVFGDSRGRIWSIPYGLMTDGTLHFGNDLEDRTSDFEPDAGKIDSPVAIKRGLRAMYILDSDGELFELGFSA